MKIEEIRDPSFLKTLNKRQLRLLCEEIRTFLVNAVSKTGGHLSSNLGIVELTVALHLIFDSPTDKLLFDVGHQAYIHKILTGRAKDFGSLRQYHGLSGFQKRYESEHDVWEAGHSSTSLSAALGFALARDYQNKHNHVVAIIGDGAFGGGMALEALNHIGSTHTNVIIVLNDNEMSISPNVGAISSLLERLRVSKFYRHSKSELKDNLSDNMVGRTILASLVKIKDIVKNNVVPGAFFQEMGIEYLGPVNGHDLDALQKALAAAKEHEGPIVVHVRTVKGKGYQFSEEDRTGKWHGVGRFNPQTGASLGGSNPEEISYSELVTNTLVRLKQTIPQMHVLTPAMRGGSKLDAFFERYPDSSHDCGIAEQHAVTLAAGLAVSGCRPFVAIYSSFLQRAYDQMNHDIARMDLPVVFGVDRSGLVGEDGETHHGVFDVGFLRALPNLIIANPKNHEELQHMLYTAFHQNHPFVIRFPRGNTKREEVEPFQALPIGKFEIPYANLPQLAVFAYGELVDEIQAYATQHQLPIMLVNVRFFKPLDTTLLKELAQQQIPWLVVERDMLSGGVASAMMEYLCDEQLEVSIRRMGISDHFVEQGDTEQLYRQEHISFKDVIDTIEELIYGTNKT